MAVLATIRRFLWVAPVIFGLVFIGSGLYMISEGLAGRDEVRDALVAEQITTADDAAIPGALVNDVATARAQEEIITEHTLGEYGPYSGMEREDPNRETYLKGVTLRTALNQAVMAFRVTDLVVGVGALVLVIGLTNVAVMAPMLYWTREGFPIATRVPGVTPAGAAR